MAIPVFTNDFTLIDDADSSTGWGALFGAMLSDGDGIQGSGARLIQYKSTGLD